MDPPDYVSYALDLYSISVDGERRFKGQSTKIYAVRAKNTPIATVDALEAKLREAGEQQEKSAAQVRAAVDRALREMHSVLDDEQRKRLAYLLRAGVLSI